MALVSIWFDEMVRTRDNFTSHLIRNCINERDVNGRPAVRPVVWNRYYFDVLENQLGIWTPLWKSNNQMGQFFFLSNGIYPQFHPEYRRHDLSDAFFVHTAGAGKLREEHLDWSSYEKEGTCPEKPVQPCKIYPIETFLDAERLSKK